MAALRHTFGQQLQELQQDVVRMGSYAVEMVELSVQSLVQQDINLANRVIQMDDQADEMDEHIEQSCIRLLSLQQPMSRDLRIISSALKIITDIERIADYSVDIAKTARRLSQDGNEFRPPMAILGMSECLKQMIRDALQAYVSGDMALVQQVVQRDDEVDDAYDQLFTDLLTQMEQNPSIIRPATWVLHVARFLERMADHTVNVAERVYFMETGEMKQLAPSHGAGRE